MVAGYQDSPSTTAPAAHQPEVACLAGGVRNTRCSELLGLIHLARVYIDSRGGYPRRPSSRTVRACEDACEDACMRACVRACEDAKMRARVLSVMSCLPAACLPHEQHEAFTAKLNAPHEVCHALPSFPFAHHVLSRYSLHVPYESENPGVSVHVREPEPVSLHKLCSLS